MEHQHIISNLAANESVFRAILSGVSREDYLWKQAENKWCLLEIVCHLYDEEREDFRKRIKHVLNTPHEPLSPIDPVGWVAERKYIEQDYEAKLEGFLEERRASIQWLNGLIDPKWEQAIQHATLGALSADLFLANWLAHDYLHIRQITKLKYDHLQKKSGEDLSYAGNW